MIKRWLPRLYAACIGSCIALLLLYPEVSIDAAKTACGVWANKVMPALFPYLVVSQLLAASIPSFLCIVPLSMLGGSPSGARLISLSRISPEKAQKLSALCTTVSPLYILGTLQGDFRMLIAHWLGAFAAWVAVCAQQKSPKAPQDTPVPVLQPQPSIPQAIADSALAMLSVCGCMVLFSVLSALLNRIMPLSRVASAALLCILEMASGCDRILSFGLSINKAAPLLCATVSFGGLSVFMQNASFLKKAGINLRIQFMAKIIHALATYGVCALLYQA